MSESEVVETVDSAPVQEPAGTRGIAAVFGPTVNAVFAPGRAFEVLESRPVLSAGILLWVVVGMIGLSFMNLDINRQLMRIGVIESMTQRSQDVDTEQLAQAVEGMDRFAPVIATVQNLFVVLLVVIVAAMIWGGSTMLGGRAKFSSALSVAAVGSVVHPLLAGCFVAFNWRINPPEIRRVSEIVGAVPSLGLDLFFGSDQMSTAVRVLLQRIDLFNIWWIVLVVIGGERLLRLKRGGAVGLALAIWLLSAAVSAGMASLGS